MTTTALLVTLAAALIHAIWNQLLAGSPDPAGRAAVGMLIAAVVFAPVALVDVRWEAEVWPYAAASVVFELVYFLALAAAYQRAPMGVVYPIARGTAPVLVLVVGILVLGQHVSWAAGLGTGLVVAGILVVRGIGGALQPRHLLLALGIGASIATYTLIDSAALAHASPFAYLELTLAATAVAQAALLVRARGAAALFGPSLRGGEAWRTSLAGVGIFGAYGLVLVALGLGPAGPVAAVRETSVVLALLMLAATGQERLTPARLLGAVVVVAGIALIVV